MTWKKKANDGSTGFYHSDRPLTQQALARALSYSLVPSLPTSESRLRFIKAFWITVGKEFHALDRLRVDKYLFLMRCFVGVAFEIYLGKKTTVPENDEEEEKETRSGRKRKKSPVKGGKATKRQKTDEKPSEDKWSELDAYISFLERGPLCPINFDPNDKKKEESNPNRKKDEEEEEQAGIQIPHGPDGIRYHLMDIWLDELEKVIVPDGDEEAEEGKGEGKGLLKDRVDVPMDILLRPFENLRKSSPMKNVRVRAQKDVLEDQRLVEWGFRSKDESEDEDEDEDSE